MKGVARGHIAILIVNIIFGLNIPIAKSVLGEFAINPLALTSFRIIGATIVFWIASLFVKSEKIKRKDYIILVLASLFGISINQLSFIIGLTTTSPIDASLIVTLTPILTMLISAAYLKEPITLKKIIGVFLGCIGALYLIVSGADFGLSGRTWYGNILVLTSCLAYASYLVFFRDFIKRYHPILLMKWMFLFAAIFTTPFTYQEVISTNYGIIEIESWIRILYVVVMATFVTYLLIPFGQKNLRPTTLSMYNYLQPIIASLVAVFASQDIFGYDKIISAILVFSGVYIVTQSKSKERIDLLNSK
ncbi:MAG: hypothetical protein H6Q15_2052 [Bacteroidetes bacterium]|nr:hypothetical protein [Bacteroidota bacterium]